MHDTSLDPNLLISQFESYSLVPSEGVPSLYICLCYGSSTYDSCPPVSPHEVPLSIYWRRNSEILEFYSRNMKWNFVGLCFADLEFL